MDVYESCLFAVVLVLDMTMMWLVCLDLFCEIWYNMTKKSDQMNFSQSYLKKLEHIIQTTFLESQGKDEIAAGDLLWLGL